MSLAVYSQSNPQSIFLSVSQSMAQSVVDKCWKDYRIVVFVYPGLAAGLGFEGETWPGVLMAPDWECAQAILDDLDRVGWELCGELDMEEQMAMA